jgi:hypothetical protein
MTGLLSVDWTTIPSPVDDGAAKSLTGQSIPPVVLTATDGRSICLASLGGTIVVYAYPMTSLFAADREMRLPGSEVGR